MSELIELLNYLNQTGGIPLVINQTTTTNPYQFFLTLVITGAMILWFVSIFFGQGVLYLFSLIQLKIFKRKNGIKHLLLIKHTTTDMFSQAMINQKTLKKVQEALMKFKGKNFDLILWTPGGEIFSAVYISRMLKQYKGKIRSFVPIYSMSGGTLLALSTNEIHMNDYSCLGAVDPQLGNLFKFGSARTWKEVLKLKKNKADDSSIAFKHMGEQYTKSIKENLKGLLIDKVNKKDLNKVVKLLTSGEVEHAFNFTKEILRSQGLRIKDIDDGTNIKLIKLIKHIPDGVFYN